MLRILSFLIFGLSIGLAGCAGFDTRSPDVVYSPPEGSIVLRVNVNDVELADRHPDCGEGCIPSSAWYVYQASVREVLTGVWHHSAVEFASLQHGQYRRAVTRDIYVVLLPASQDLKGTLGIDYVAERMLSKRIKQHRSTIEDLRSTGARSPNKGFNRTPVSSRAAKPGELSGGAG